MRAELRRTPDGQVARPCRRLAGCAQVLFVPDLMRPHAGGPGRRRHRRRAPGGVGPVRAFEPAGARALGGYSRSRSACGPWRSAHCPCEAAPVPRRQDAGHQRAKRGQRLLGVDARAPAATAGGRRYPRR
ncbi:hypothetical protein [Nonomuraea dietziae]|uniref:hypothetical protein n=1 Tax=Nonomuraea dietziae TaxID=65515 RepID=UPI0031CEE45F